MTFLILNSDILNVLSLHIIQICSGITLGKVHNGQLYDHEQRLQKLICLHLFTDFHENFSPLVGTSMSGEKSS